MSRKVKIRTVKTSSARQELLKKRWPRSKWSSDLKLKAYVESIIEEVKKKGDTALLKFTEKFDGVKMKSNALHVTKEEIQAAYERVTDEQVSALKFLKKKVESLEKQLLKRLSFEYEISDIKIYSQYRPIRNVGCYVPGGEASYPSTLIMTCTPAKVCGVSRVVVCSPPMASGEANPLTLVAADICGVDEFYKVGGAQAIAALAYGTDAIEPVEKIVGPGNKYVTMAKIIVSQDVAIDMPAGPSEILVLADDSADPRLVALDMLSQSEHGVESISVLVTMSGNLADNVVKEVGEILFSLPRGENIAEALSRNGSIVLCKDMNEAITFVNEFAPEHLEIITNEPMSVAEQVVSAGLILIGSYTPVSVSDYSVGTNHVLPTGGFGHVYSILSVLDFVRRFNVVVCSKKWLLGIRNHVRVLAEAEGLLNHALAVDGRFEGGY